MRIYLPATLTELPGIDVAADGQASMTLSPRRAHALTSALRRAHPDEDEEGLEYAALLAAADDDLALLTENPQAPQLRLVLTLEVPDDAVGACAPDAAILNPSAVEVESVVEGAVVVCAHVDEPAAAADVIETLAGDDKAVERLIDRDLLWYDTSEFSEIPQG